MQSKCTPGISLGEWMAARCQAARCRAAVITCTQVECQPPGEMVMRVTDYSVSGNGSIRVVPMHVAGSGTLQSVELRTSAGEVPDISSPRELLPFPAVALLTHVLHLNNFFPPILTRACMYKPCSLQHFDCSQCYGQHQLLDVDVISVILRVIRVHQGTTVVAGSRA